MSVDGCGSNVGQSTFLYAQYLGVDLQICPDLQWLVESSLCAPLPADWIKERRGDQVFYHNMRTKESAWAHPLELLHKDVGGKIVRLRSRLLSEGERAAECDSLRRKCVRMLAELQGIVCVVENGERLFRNQVTEHVSTTDPRPALLHVVKLHEKALKAIGNGAHGLSSIAEHSAHSQRPCKQRTAEAKTAAASAAAAAGTVSHARMISSSSMRQRHAPQKSSCEAILPAIDAHNKLQCLEGKPLHTDKKEKRVRRCERASLKTMACVRLEPSVALQELDLLE